LGIEFLMAAGSPPERVLETVIAGVGEVSSVLKSNKDLLFLCLLWREGMFLSEYSQEEVD